MKANFHFVDNTIVSIYFIHFHIYLQFCIRDFSSFAFDIFLNHNLSGKMNFCESKTSRRLKASRKFKIFNFISIRDFDYIFLEIVKFLKKIYKFKKLSKNWNLIFTSSIIQCLFTSYIFIFISRYITYYIRFRITSIPPTLKRSCLWRGANLHEYEFESP